VVEAQSSPHNADDGIIYFLTHSELFRYQEQGQQWSRCQALSGGEPVFGERDFGRYFSDLAVAALTERTHLLFLGSMGGEFYRIRAVDLTCSALKPVEPPNTPQPTPSPTPCSEAVDEGLESALLASKGGALVLERLGCAGAKAEVTGAALQPFEGGAMIWREDVRQIYVLPNVVRWTTYEDTWEETGKPEPEMQPPRGLYAPVRGFGKLWREQLEGPVSVLGWATAPERGTTLVIQVFANGLLLYSADEGQLWVLYADGAWANLN
jgi:hypothetical protein